MARLTSWILTGGLAAGVLLSHASSALALDDPAPTVVHTQTIEVDRVTLPASIPASRIDDLEKAYSGGDIQTAQNLARQILDGPKLVKDHATRPYDYKKSQIIVVWPALQDDKYVLRRMNVPPPDHEPYGSDLPGVGTDDGPELYEVFVSLSLEGALITDYASTPVENPLTGQLVDIVGRIITPLFSLVSDVAGSPHKLAQGAAAPQLHLVANRVRLPFRRASLVATSKAQLPLTQERATQLVNALTAELLLKDTTYSPWARSFAVRMAEAAKDAIATCTTLVGGVLPNASDCKTAFVDSYRAAHKACIDDGGCAPTNGAKPSSDDLAAVDKMTAAFHDFAESGATESISLQSTFRNEPPTHLTFGLVTGLVMGSPSPNRARVKLKDDGTLAADPVGRQISMIVVNVSLGYNAASTSPTWKERVRAFGGGIITPDFGLGGGGSLLLVRGVAVNVGGGVLFSRGLGDDDKVGVAPQDDKKPFALAHMYFWFVGASFNFK